MTAIVPVLAAVAVWLVSRLRSAPPSSSSSSSSSPLLRGAAEATRQAGQAAALAPAAGQAMARAIATGDPGVIRATGVELVKAGATQAAASLAKVADAIDPARTVPPSVAVPLPGPGIVSTEDPRRELARQLTADLVRRGRLRAKYREDRALVKRYQAAEGLSSDGLYGPAAAARIIDRGLVPVAPFYWPRDARAASVARALLDRVVSSKETGDAPRAAEWRALRSEIDRSYRGLQ